MLEDGMKLYLADKGIKVKAVLIGDIELPALVKSAVEATKQREEQVNQQAQALQIRNQVRST